MIIWNGWGFLVAVITFGCSFLLEWFSEKMMGSETYYQENSAPLAIALLLAGLISGFLGNWLNTRKAKVFIDKETGQEVIMKDKHSLFFIPMEHWGIILAGLSIFVFIKDKF
ncbi:hypothetical protein VH441_05055 [Psychrobacter sp. HD31]|uniref:hypothetical protein n=1 Tax=Psychrobacter sp. HD31 TaxID=3112003 RepID=UPI003DA64BF1